MRNIVKNNSVDGKCFKHLNYVQLSKGGEVIIRGFEQKRNKGVKSPCLILKVSKGHKVFNPISSALNVPKKHGAVCPHPQFVGLFVNFKPSFAISFVGTYLVSYFW